MNLLIFSLVTIIHTGQGRPGVIQDIANWISGIKYVPPPADDKISNSKENLFKPVEKVTATTQRALPSSTVLGISDENVVFNRSEGWLQPAGSEYLYKLGEEAATWYESRYWCAEQGGQLAEIYSGEEMELVRRMLERDTDVNYWLGLEKESRVWLSSGRSRVYQHWVEGEPSNRYDERCVILQVNREYF